MSDGANPGGPTPPPPPPAAPPPPPPGAPQSPPPPPPYGAPPGYGTPNPQPGWTAAPGAPVPTAPTPTVPAPTGYPQPGYPQPGYQQPGYQQPAYGYGSPPPYLAPNYDMRPKRSGGAITALVFGLLSIPLFFLFVPAIVAFVVGLVAAHKIKTSNGLRTGLGMARAGWILGFLSFAGMTTLVVLIASGVIESDTNVNDLEAGQCVELDPGDSDTVFSLPTVDCAEPHGGEVYHVGTLDRFDAGVDYPGQRRVQAAVELQCVGRVFTDYVGVDYNESEYQLYSLSPSEDSWGGGDRSFICIAQGSDGDLVGSVRDTRR